MPRDASHAHRLNRRQYWQRTRRLTGILLFAWFFATVGIVMFARQLSAMTMFGWPVSYYMAAQGVILIYVAIVGIYTVCMSSLDKRLAKEDDDGE